MWLNGRKVADAKSVVGMFRRFHFNVSPFVRPEGPNALAVCIHTLDFPGSPVHEQLDGLPGMFRPCGGDGEILRNVTEYCSMGWDWVAPVRDRNMGIWQHVWLEATGPVAVRDPAAMTAVRLPDAAEAAVTIRCQLENSTPLRQAVELVATIAHREPRPRRAGRSADQGRPAAAPVDGSGSQAARSPVARAAQASTVVAGDVRPPTALPAHGPGTGGRPAKQPGRQAIRRADGGLNNFAQRRAGVHRQRANHPHDRRGLDPRLPYEWTPSATATKSG